MKIKYADIIKSRRILGKEFTYIYINKDNFKGYVGISYFSKIAYPKYVTIKEKEILVLDNGFTWIQYFGDNDEYATTVMYDEKGNIAQWYVDICTGNRLTDKGIPYFRDMYLDLEVSSSEQIQILDEDEIDEALENGDVTKEEYNRAYEVLYKVKEEIEQGLNPTINLSKSNYDELIKILHND